MFYTIKPLSKPINAEVVISGSKSFTSRALIIASLTNGMSILIGASNSHDTLVLRQALRKLGIHIRKSRRGLEVLGKGGDVSLRKGEINIGMAGTAMRFLTALCALVESEITLDGDERMRQRPIEELVKALKKIGAKIDYLGKTGYPPLKIQGGSLKGGKVEMEGSLSSQYFTALLLIAPFLKNGLELLAKNNLTSKSYLDMTLETMREHGAKAEKLASQNAYKIEYQKNPYKPGIYNIEIDATGAAYFWALAAITKSKIRVKNISFDSSQGDAQFPKLLEQMGCEITENKKNNWIEAQGPASLKAITADMANMPDSAQTLAVAAAFAKGETKITGLSTLKIKETDRLIALKKELAKIGIKAKTTKTSITIQGGSPRGAEIETYNDHRMAMSFALAGAKIPDIKIKDPEVVSKSFPDFWKILRKLELL